jgi:hypothetical protein
VHRATIALRQSMTPGTDADSGPLFSSRETRRGYSRKWALAGSLAMLVGLVITTALWRTWQPRQTQADGTPSIAIDQTVLRQIKALFGPQLNAVIEYAGKAPDIRLTEGAEVGPGGQSQPVVIEFRRGGDTVRVLGFSGRTVCMQLAGRQTCFEPLATGDGGVIVTAERFCWTPQDSAAQLCGYQVSARLLSRS